MKIMKCHGIPEELDLKQWIITYIDVNNNPPLKRPYKMKTTSDPALYKDYETVINEICNNYTNTVLLPAFMLNGTCVWCVDLDNHEEEDIEKSKEIDAFNNEIIEKAKDYNLYITLSNSQKGFHVFGLFDSPEQRKLFKNYRNDNGKFEFYNGINKDGKEVVKYICEDPENTPIFEPERIKSGTDFLYYLLEKCPDADILISQTSTEEETKENTPTMTTGANEDTPSDPSELPSSSDTKENKKPENKQDAPTFNNNDTTFFCVQASELTAEQIVKVIRNHKDLKTREEVERIFNGSLSNPSEDLQTLYNVVYYWTPDFNKFIDVLQYFSALYSHYVKTCKHKNLQDEINRKLEKTNLSSKGHFSIIRFDKVTGEFVGFGNPKATEITIKKIKPTSIEENTEFKTVKSINYVKNILQTDPLLKDLVYNNTFTHELVKTKYILWNSNFEVVATNIKDKWNNTDDAGLRLYLERKYKLIKCKDVIDDAFKVAWEFGNQRHPIKDFFETLEPWDGTERVPTLLTDYMGAEDTEFTRQVIIKMLSACYQRIYKPGCKFDYMCVLVGKQGIGKSSFIKGLAGNYFGSISSSIDFDKGVEKITGKWIVEFDELATFKKSGVETIKAFITTTKDTFRVPYEKRPEDRQRQTVFFGTTNDKSFLRDTTGNRRFWIVECGKQQPTKQWQSMKEEIRQIWAEIKEKYSDCQLYLTPELEEYARAIQETHTFEDPWKDLILNYLNMQVPEDWPTKSIIERVNYIKTYEDFNRKEERKNNPDVYKYKPALVCPVMLFKEAIQRDADAVPKKNQSCEINKIMDSLPNWEKTHAKMPQYGDNKGHKKIKNN